MPYLYRYIDIENEETVYIGKIRTYYDQDCTCPKDGLYDRHKQHRREKWYEDLDGDYKLVLQYIPLSSHTDADILETWLIQYYDKEQLVNQAKTGWGESCIDLSNEIFGKWQNYTRIADERHFFINREASRVINNYLDGIIDYDNMLNKFKELSAEIQNLKREMDNYNRLKEKNMQGIFRRRIKEEK